MTFYWVCTARVASFASDCVLGAASAAFLVWIDWFSNWVYWVGLYEVVDGHCGVVVATLFQCYPIGDGYAFSVTHWVTVCVEAASDDIAAVNQRFAN